MRRFFTLLLLGLSMSAFAYDKATEGQAYYGSECEAYGLADGTVAITKYYISDGQTEVIFPATIQEWKDETMIAEYEVSQVGYSDWKNVYFDSASSY